MKDFINDSFLLLNQPAETLYHDYAAEMPIIDYHCHLSPEEVANNRRWQNLTQVWLYGDHYKWRAMRANGINEHYITGEASDREKFDKFAKTMPYLLRNPLYHWSHMELKRFFGINELLSPQTADSIWEQSQEVLASHLNAMECLKRNRVEIVCTTDDPTDDLYWHKLHAESRGEIVMLPTWRPDKVFQIENIDDYNHYLDELEEVSGVSISSYRDLLEALRHRHDYFASMGCRLSDYGMDSVPFAVATDARVASIFSDIRAGKALDQRQGLQFKSALLLDCARMDASKGWTRQLHMGVTRNKNTRMFKQVGVDAGFDSLSDASYGESLALHLDCLNSDGLLGKTILYNLNPRDNELLASLIGVFQDGEIAGKMQLGSGWWFSDQMDGIKKQIEVLSQYGLLSRFVGMLTDSRSFLSYVRHEYFRRILCQILGEDMERGYIPHDYELVGNMVRDICYHNANEYFGFRAENGA